MYVYMYVLLFCLQVVWNRNATTQTEATEVPSAAAAVIIRRKTTTATTTTTKQINNNTQHDNNTNTLRQST
jgi:hypothetical protein